MSQFDPQQFLQNVTRRPGVYQMYNDKEKLLYVGKAKNLKNRLSSYFRARGLNSKTVALVSHIASIEVIVTQSETEALILEQTLIKKHRPKYNILLKDDKSYPFIHITQSDYPLLVSRRGKRSKTGKYYGPYPNATAVRESINHLQKIFQLRSCEDSYFKNRGRPCLQHQIKRCSAPCVGLIAEQDYAEDIKHAEMFLRGDSRHLLEQIEQQMAESSAQLEFEKAAHCRDQIQYLRVLQEQQYVNVDNAKSSVDIWAGVQQSGVSCIHRLSVRNGALTSSKSYFPDNKLEQSLDKLRNQFIAQYYISSDAIDGQPKIILSKADDEESLQELKMIALAVGEQSGKKCRAVINAQKEKRAWLNMASNNAQLALTAKLGKQDQGRMRLDELAKLIDWPHTLDRVECFDISHAQGEATIASCVVFDKNGADKSRYRRFNIKDVQAGDDYAAIEQAVYRHMARQQEAQDLPSVLLIDGGKGQLKSAFTALEQLDIKVPEQVLLLAISKGVTRKSGWEYIWQQGVKQPLQPNAHNQGFLLLQEVRDEAHRFAITGHRKKRAKARLDSGLESIAGIGPKRRKALMQYFGSFNEIKSASQQELEKVEGISAKTAEDIYSALHGSLD